MIHFVRSNWLNVGTIVMTAVVVLLLWGWGSSQQKLANERRDTISDYREMLVKTYAANSILLNSWQYEAHEAGKFEVRMQRANGRLGPMQRQINEQQKTIDRLAEWMRGGFTGEIDMRVRK